MKSIRPNQRKFTGLQPLKPWLKFAPLLSIIVAVGIQVNFKTTVCDGDGWGQRDCVHNVGLVSDRQNLILITLGAGVVSGLITRK